MNVQQITAMVSVAVSIIAGGVLAAAAQDRFTLQSPNGIAFSEFKDYQAWQIIAPSHPDDAGGCGGSPAPGCIKAIVGNPAMIKAYGEGFPANGKAVPEGAAMAKIEWAKKRHTGAPYAATLPGPLAKCRSW